jgi:hypothetical protein
MRATGIACVTNKDPSLMSVRPKLTCVQCLERLQRWMEKRILSPAN